MILFIKFIMNRSKPTPAASHGDIQYEHRPLLTAQKQRKPEFTHRSAVFLHREEVAVMPARAKKTSKSVPDNRNATSSSLTTTRAIKLVS